MYCNYRVYYNNSCLLLTCDKAQINENFSKIFEDPNLINQLVISPDFLFDPNYNENVAIYSEKPGEIMCTLLENLEVIIAGGGIVTNENDELLLIYRRGYWDLAKGKIELKEKIIDGALREVEEETGVKIASIDEKPCITYHAYKLKGRNCLKETSWFKMKAQPGQHNLKPQLEEDIEQVLWVPKTELVKYKDKTYPLVWHILSKFAAENHQPSSAA
jgi:8-oxo-dGTP pyrophosphatase MutT (NUDIX family)